MKKITAVSNDLLLSRTKKLVLRERKIVMLLIEHLEEIQRRMIYAELGLSSMWAFCTEYLKLSEGSAQRYLQAMRLGRDVPQAKVALAEGKLSVSNAARVQSFFQAEKKRVGVSSAPLSKTKKEEVLKEIEGMSQRQCEQKLYSLFPESAVLGKEKVSPISEDQNVLKIVLDSATLKKLELLKDRLAHTLPNASYSDLIQYMAEQQLLAVEKKYKLSKSKEDSEISAISAAVTSPSVLEEPKKPTLPHSSQEDSAKLTIPVAASFLSREIQSRSSQLDQPAPRKHISIKSRRIVWDRAGDRCEFISADGRRCNSTRALEIDHLIPKVHGGDDSVSNLMLCCKIHNLYRAQMTLGYMQKYVPSLS